MNKKIIATGISAFLICGSLFISEANAIQYTIQGNSTSVEGDFNSGIEINRGDNSSDYCENSCNHSYTNSGEYTITIDSTNAEKISELDLSNANITNIINMSGATNITYLNLKNNKINHIEDNAFEGSIFKNGKRIAYQRNGTSYTETDKSCQRGEQGVDEICHDESSRTINLSNNELKEIPEMFNNDDRYGENPQVYRTKVILSNNLSNIYTHPPYRFSHGLSDPPRIVNLKNNPITLLTPPVEITKEKACFYNGPYHRSEPFDCEFFTRNYNSENPNILSKYTLKDPLGGIFTGETSGVLTGGVREFGISPFHSTEDDKNNVAHRINGEYTLSIDILSGDDIIASRSDTFNIEFATLRIISPYENQTINYNIHDQDAGLDFELQLRREKMTESRLPSPSFNCEITINNSNYNCELSKLPTGPYYYEDYEIGIFLKDNLDNPRQLLTPEGTGQIKVSLKNRRGETVTDDTFNFKYTTLYSVTLDNQEATTPGTEKYYYKFNTTGSTPDGTAVYYWQNEACTDSLLQIEIPTKSGYIFDGYYTDINGSGTQYIDSSGHYINNLRKTVTGDTTLYAKWTAEPGTNPGGGGGGNTETTYTVTITSSNTGYGTVSSGSVTANSGTTISTNGNTLTIGSTNVIATPNNSNTTIESFSFSGWTNKCGNSLTGDCEIIADFNKSSPEHGDDPTPQPGTQEREFTLTFDTDGGSPIAPITGVYGSTISKPNNPTKTGYTFSGWNPAIPDKMPTNNLTVTAQRTANKYKVEFNANSGQGRMGQQDFIYDISENLNQNQFTKSGYTFSGWNTSPSGNQTWFTDQQFVKNLTGTSGAVVTLYAQWTAEPGTNPGGGGGGNTETTYTVTITPYPTSYGSVSHTSVTANSGTTISTNGNTLTIGSTNVIATPNNSNTTIESFSFSGWTNKCGNSLTGDCEIIADFKLNNQGNNGGNGSQSSSTSSSNGGSSGKSHKNEEKKSETEDTDYVKTIYELINNTRENHININKDETIQSNQFFSKYISRSCKPYNIEYIPSLNAYTSPDLKKKEYFVNIEYFKRYVDSKNAQNAECYVTNRSRITTSYIDTSNSNNRFVAPNGKIYFINQQNGSYRSSDINSSKNFTTIDELKNYIKKRNPLIPM